MSVDPETAPHRHQLGNATYHFCSAGCASKFETEPDRYLNPPDSDPAVLQPAMGTLPEPAERSVWTCPMHPQVRRPGPGSCPICGMALEPAAPTLEEGPNLELIDMARRFWVSTALSLPLLVLAMGHELFGWTLLPTRASTLVQLGLATPVVLWGGWPTVAGAGRAKPEWARHSGGSNILYCDGHAKWANQMAMDYDPACATMDPVLAGKIPIHPDDNRLQ